ncbi:lipopolysaccharide assembly protein LapA domain-containing protein [Roseospira goensis]|uniref:Putative integral membrane protein n=1 Tax=Roseospira goensis TaxID=391922 RepID=A0A7W6RZR4_9PROT|nr:putative integral membrane protein [Roseospira goensis]
MFKFFAWVIGVPVIVIAVFFAIDNQDPVVLGLWPTQYELQVPLYWAVEGALLAGFIIGVFLTWLAGGRARGQVRHYRRETNSARREAANATVRAERAEAKLKEAGKA